MSPGAVRGDGNPLPAIGAARQRLLDAASVLGLGLNPTQIDHLLTYLGLLQRWNRVYNLSALRDAEAIVNHHLIDCLAVLPALRRHAAGAAQRVLDVGSGGGLPGIVLAIAQPRWSVVCVDAVAKKASFVTQVAAELGLPNLRSLHARVESMPTQVEGFDLIVSRAFASLADFTRLSAAALAEGGAWAAMKGRPTPQEFAQLPSEIEMFHVEQLDVPGVDVQRCLIWLRPR